MSKKLSLWEKGLKFLFNSSVTKDWFAPAEADTNFDISKHYDPQAVQQEFLKLVAKEYDYVALGDTDHRREAIREFAFSVKTVAALSAGGVDHVFLEARPENQDYYDMVSDPQKLSQLADDAYRQGKGNMWIGDAGRQERLTDIFERAAQKNPKVKFVAADKRHTDGHPFKEFAEDNKSTFKGPLEIYKEAYGKVGLPIFAIIGASLFLQGKVKRFTEVLTDDTQTADFIHSTSKKGAIFYGAAHFGRGKTLSTTSMKALLTEKGASLSHINIVENESQIAAQEKLKLKPDAVLLIEPTEEHPFGIITYDDKMEELLIKAVENHAHDYVQQAVREANENADGIYIDPSSVKIKFTK